MKFYSLKSFIFNEIGDLNGVKDYVENQNFDVNQPDTSIKKRTPLHYAADFGQGT